MSWNYRTLALQTDEAWLWSWIGSHSPDRTIEARALTSCYQPVVDRIGCFRGFKTQAAMAIAHAWKCQHRLYKVFHRLAAKKPKQVVAEHPDEIHLLLTDIMMPGMNGVKVAERVREILDGSRRV